LLAQEYEWRAGRVVQVVECLSSKHEALSSKPSTAKKKKVCLETLVLKRKRRIGELPKLDLIP
jgi:hypothetical protein